MIDETGDRKDGHRTAHVSRQYLANLGKIDNGVVSVSSLWADEAGVLPSGLGAVHPSGVRGLGQAGSALSDQAGARPGTGRTRHRGRACPFRAMVADSFYGEDRTLRQGLRSPRACAMCWRSNRRMRGGIPSGMEQAHCKTWRTRRLDERRTARQWVQLPGPSAMAAQPGLVGLGNRDRPLWASQDGTGDRGHHRSARALPDLSTLYLVTNLPAPGSQRAQASSLCPPPALEEVMRLYGLRMWVEQSYKQVKHALGWSQYQVRSDKAIRRHWQLVCCAFSFCWYHSLSPAAALTQARKRLLNRKLPSTTAFLLMQRERGKKISEEHTRATTGVLAGGPAGSARMVGALDHAAALLERLVATAPTSCVASAAPVA